MKTEKIIAPVKCPFCGAPIVKQIDEGAHLYCSNEDCSERNIQKLNYFVSKQCINIDGLSEKTIRKLYSMGLVKYWQDLMKLCYSDFIKNGFGEKTAKKIDSEIKKAISNSSLSNILTAISIPFLGKVGVDKLIEKFNDVTKILNASIDSYINILGDVKGNSVYSYIHNHTEELMDISLYFNINDEKIEKPSNNTLADLTFIATGTLTRFSREDIKKSVIDNGGKYASGISKNVTYLIIGDKPSSSKVNKANSLGIKIITEDEYLQMIV